MRKLLERANGGVPWIINALWAILIALISIIGSGWREDIQANTEVNNRQETVLAERKRVIDAYDATSDRVNDHEARLQVVEATQKRIDENVRYIREALERRGQ